jgi:hypothetical protein
MVQMVISKSVPPPDEAHLRPESVRRCINVCVEHNAHAFRVCIPNFGQQGKQCTPPESGAGAVAPCAKEHQLSNASLALGSSSPNPRTSCSPKLIYDYAHSRPHFA